MNNFNFDLSTFSYGYNDSGREEKNFNELIKKVNEIATERDKQFEATKINKPKRTTLTIRDLRGK